MSDPSSPARKGTPEERATRWLAQGFETLVASLEGDPQRTAQGIDFDVVVVGTGYGGAVAAAELAKTRGSRRICVLERGNEHLPGSFPSRMADLPGHVRFSKKDTRHARGRRDGLFDVRIGEDLCAVVGNGLGGGSLINAGVMALPDKGVFGSAHWPAAFHREQTVEALFELAGALKDRLGATRTVQSVDFPEPRKFQALGSFHGGVKVEPLPITVALTGANEKDFKTRAGVRVDACVRCGNCATGCNYNAKVSLDVTLLAEARQHGAELFTGATVLKIEKALDAGGKTVWHLHVVHTDEPLRRRHGTPTVIRARRVVLAAGTFGSTEILLRSQGAGLRLSHKLGHQVSANGDLIAAAYAGKEEANCAADEDVDPRGVADAKRVGPTITGMLDLRATDGMLIQDLAVPGPLRSLLEQSVTTASAIHMLGEADERPHGAETQDVCAVDDAAIRNTLMVAIIGHDSADGVMKLNASGAWDDGDGAATIQWPTLRDYPPLQARHRRFEELLRASGARALPNPMWQLMPEKLTELLGGETGPLLTVHPLGGCPMGDDAASGVVDEWGRVFDAAPRKDLKEQKEQMEEAALHEGLVVLDGSIIPASLGINPALTIAGVALRAVGQLRTQWGYTEGAPRLEIGSRPWFKTPGMVEPSKDTLIEVLERLSGPVPIRGIDGPGSAAAHVELTMRFDPIATRDLASGTAAATLRLQPAHGRLRIFAEPPPEDTEPADEAALLVATVKGSLRAFSHKQTSPAARRWQGLWAWFRNRGLRDSVLWVIDRWKGKAPENDKGFLQEAMERGRSLWALSSRAGGTRLLEYDLVVESVLASKLPAYIQRSIEGAAIQGRKELTYSRRANPWRQLSQVSLTAFPRARKAGAVLELDTGYLARQKTPLFRIVQQQDHVKALVDVAALGLYLTRMLIQIHAWSFRLPDEPQPRDIQRLPGYVPGLPPPQVHEFPVSRPRNGKPVMVRLTHYPYSQSRRARAMRANPAAQEAILTPILLIHGYSASGTTFAHHSVRPNVASSLWDRGRDVWIADLRTSAGMPHAREPWAFEQVGYADIPVAVHKVCAMTGVPKIDVFAHCMGSAMLGMALLGTESDRERFLPLRRDLPNRIRRLVMSQVAPAVVFTPANTFRAYAMQYLRHFLPLHDYEFRPAGRHSHKDRLIDRFLATLPYPEEEFDRENPFWPPWRRTPWVGTRHRMDALYGRDFNVNNLSSRMLEYIDDHFGPLSIETVSQAVHFARLRAITTRKGFNDFVRPDRLREKLRFPIMHVHGRQNGLASNRTPAHFRKVLTDSDARFESDRAFLPKLYDAGHQDLLIGAPAEAMFRDMNAYLEAPFAPVVPEQTGIRITFSACIPAFGVRAPQPLAGSDRCSLGDEGASGAPVAALLIPVAQHEGGYLPLDDNGRPVKAAEDELVRLVAWRALKPVSPEELATRYTFELDGYALPQGACGVLVLVLYNMSAALQPGVDRFNSDLAGRVAEKAKGKGGHGLASLAAMAADPKGVTLPGIEASADLAGRIAREMAKSVRRTLEGAASVELGLGILNLQRREALQAPSSTRCFALASCQYPGDILDRTPPRTPEDAPAGPSDASYLRLLALLEGRRAGKAPLPIPEFLVLTGDQIYADATAGLFDARRLDDRYRISYEAFFGARGPRAVLSRLPAVMQPDDHEIGDNWEPDPDGAFERQETERLRQKGIREFLRNQWDEDCDGGATVKLWRQAPAGGFEFFWSDARTARTPRTAATVGSASMLGEEQTAALDKWLADRSVEGPRFFVSAPMVLPRHLQTRGAATASAIRSDAWDGFPASLHRLLARVYERGTGDVVFLSGDAHVSNVARIEISKVGAPGVVVAHSIHSSALYAPYPFANGIEEHFAGNEVFEFSHEGAAYRCSVETSFPSVGDGFAVLTVATEGAGWAVNVRFDRAEGTPFDAVNSFDFRIGGAAVPAPAPSEVREGVVPA
ncbi:alpha/beta fold hydrolase [Ramlibacter henchirensis]|nr:alpha/beta fold hydrolase [Ramlibacter henchirensis]